MTAPATDTWIRGEGDYANLLLLPWNTARERYYEGRITGAEWDAYCNAWDALHPVEGQYGHVSIGCEAARCSHYRGGKP